MDNVSILLINNNNWTTYSVNNDNWANSINYTNAFDLQFSNLHREKEFF